MDKQQNGLPVSKYLNRISVLFAYFSSSFLADLATSRVLGNKYATKDKISSKTRENNYKVMKQGRLPTPADNISDHLILIIFGHGYRLSL